MMNFDIAGRTEEKPVGTAAAALRCDTVRQFGRSSAALILIGALKLRTFRPVVTMRLCQRASESRHGLKVLLPVFSMLHRLSSSLAGVELPWRTEIGAGFAVHHGFGLVIAPGARIGRDVTLLHGVTLGRRDRLLEDGARESGYPTIEDEVWIGPHVVIVGDVVIGRGSRIAAGSVLTRSVPPYSMVAGNPARIIREGCRPDVINPSTRRAALG